MTVSRLNNCSNETEERTFKDCLLSKWNTRTNLISYKVDLNINHIILVEKIKSRVSLKQKLNVLDYSMIKYLTKLYSTK